MPKWGVTLGAALLLALPVAAASGSTSQADQLLQTMNRVRTHYGLAPLRVDPHLQRAALSHSSAMIADDVFAHGAFGSRLTEFDVRASIAGENLAWGSGPFGSPQRIVDEWLQSPVHRANLLRPSFTRVGIGDVTGRFQGYADAHVVTADFAG